MSWHIWSFYAGDVVDDSLNIVPRMSGRAPKCTFGMNGKRNRRMFPMIYVFFLSAHIKGFELVPKAALRLTRPNKNTLEKTKGSRKWISINGAAAAAALQRNTSALSGQTMKRVDFVTRREVKNPFLPKAGFPEGWWKIPAIFNRKYEQIKKDIDDKNVMTSDIETLNI